MDAQIFLARPSSRWARAAAGNPGGSGSCSIVEPRTTGRSGAHVGVCWTGWLKIPAFLPGLEPPAVWGVVPVTLERARS